MPVEHHDNHKDPLPSKVTLKVKVNVVYSSFKGQSLKLKVTSDGQMSIYQFDFISPQIMFLQSQNMAKSLKISKFEFCDLF